VSIPEDLTVAEALEAILETVGELAIEEISLLESLNRILAEPVRSKTNLPPFSNSSMDGYAVVAEDVQDATAERPVILPVFADIAAGKVADQPITPGNAARITTGAPMPKGADAVVPVEQTSEPWRDAERPLPKQIKIFRSAKSGDYVRLPGEDVKEGELVFEKGVRIRPQEIGMLASLGYDRVLVVRQPRVGILATGDELVPIEQALQPGQIRNSNSYSQAAQVISLNAIPILLGVAGDSEKSVREHLQAGVEKGVDLFVSSAGVSVGAYDHVKSVLEADGNVGFWRVRMRPGKPLAFGTYQGIPYLGLPGNPVSAMVSFERFARPALLKMAGSQLLERPTMKVKMLDSLDSDGRESYIRAVVRLGNEGYEAKVTGLQGSHMQSSLTKANALVIIPGGVKFAKRGTILEAMMIDWPNYVF
jgi:molybdopterin molybdotransferase